MSTRAHTSGVFLSPLELLLLLSPPQNQFSTVEWQHVSHVFHAQTRLIDI